MSKTGQSSNARLRNDRTLAYTTGAGAVVAGWLLDVAVLGPWPWRTLIVRALWGVVLLACGALVRAGHEGDVVGSLSSLATSVAMVALAWCTGGSSSLIFPVLAFMPVLISQVEPDRRPPLYSSIVTVLIGSMTLLLSEGRPLVMLAGWAAWTLFLGWWAVLWSGRMHAQKIAELTMERRESEMQRERAQAIEGRARALEELAAAEQRRTSAERLAAVGRLATGVAHEINNPLAFVKANLEFAADVARAGDLAQVAALNVESLEGVARIEQIVNDLRDLSRDPAIGTGETVAVATAIFEARRLSSVRLRAVADVTSDVEPGLLVFCSRGRLVQVLINLLVNAADALESAGRTAGGRIVTGARTDGERVRVWVEENGPGVPPELAEKIFDPFFTTKQMGAGIGIGLTLSKEFAQAQGGDLLLEKSDLGGARFVLDLPLAGIATPAAAA